MEEKFKGSHKITLNVGARFSDRHKEKKGRENIPRPLMANMPFTINIYWKSIDFYSNLESYG